MTSETKKGLIVRCEKVMTVHPLPIPIPTPPTYTPHPLGFFFFYWPFQGGSSVAVLLYFCVGDFICGVCFVYTIVLSCLVSHIFFTWCLSKVVLHVFGISWVLNIEFCVCIWICVFNRVCNWRVFNIKMTWAVNWIMIREMCTEWD